MSIPVVDLITSIIEPDQWQEFFYQPYASGTPTGWSATNLPPGVTIDGTTGQISGTPTTPGVARVGLTASNADGDSFPATVITIAVAPAPYSNPANVGVNVFIDTVSWKVTFEVPDMPQIIGGDGILFYIQFRKGTVVQDLGTLATLNLAIKEFEGDEAILIGEGTVVESVGSGDALTYLLYVEATGEKLAAAFSDYEKDESDEFIAIAQFECTAPNDTGVGANPIRRSSRIFNLLLVHNLVAE